MNWARKCGKTPGNVCSYLHWSQDTRQCVQLSPLITKHQAMCAVISIDHKTPGNVCSYLHWTQHARQCVQLSPLNTKRQAMCAVISIDHKTPGNVCSYLHWSQDTRQCVQFLQWSKNEEFEVWRLLLSCNAKQKNKNRKNLKQEWLLGVSNLLCFGEHVIQVMPKQNSQYFLRQIVGWVLTVLFTQHFELLT